MVPRTARPEPTLMSRLAPESLDALDRAAQLSYERNLVEQAAKVQSALRLEAAHRQQRAVREDEVARIAGQERIEAAERALRARQADEFAAALEEASHAETERRRQRLLGRAEHEAAMAAEQASAAASSREAMLEHAAAERKAAAAARKETLARFAIAEAAAAAASEKRNEQKAAEAAARQLARKEEMAERAAERAELGRAKMARVVELREQLVEDTRRLVEAQQEAKRARVDARREATERRVHELKVQADEKRGLLRDALQRQEARDEEYRQQCARRLEEKAEGVQRTAAERQQVVAARAALKERRATEGRERVHRAAASLIARLEHLEGKLDERAQLAASFEAARGAVLDERRRRALAASVERHRLSGQMQGLLVEPRRAELGALALPPRLCANPMTDHARALLGAVDPAGSGAVRPEAARASLRASSSLPTLHGPHQPPPARPLPLKLRAASTPPPPRRADALPAWPTARAADEAEQKRAWAQRHVWEPPQQREYSLDYYGPLVLGGAGYATGWTPPATAVAQGLAQPGFTRVPPEEGPLAHSLPALRGVPRGFR